MELRYLETRSVAGNLLFPRCGELNRILLPLISSKRILMGRADFIQSGAELKAYKWWNGVILPPSEGWGTM